jgi:hypothetical protein
MQSDYQLNFKEFENGQNICKSSGIFLFSSMDFWKINIGDYYRQ